MKNFKFILAVLTFSLFATSAFAQSNTGSLVGTVVDQQGSVVAGATVVVTDNSTSKERTLETSGDGTFTLPQLETGIYTVKISAPGFKTFTATSLKIDIGQPYSLNAALEPGGVQENVTVVAGADVINATSGELSHTVSPRQVQELPLNGRNPLSLINLQPGVTSSGQGTNVINGMRASSTSYFRDGINVQDNFIRSGFVPDRPNVDDTGEFTIVTQNGGAELGYGGSIVLLNTPRGTSEYHGALFEYNRNSKFAANNFFNNRSNTPRPFLNRNQFGGKIAGPMPLPRFGEGGSSLIRDKAFFFAAYEGFRLRQSTIAQRTILTSNARTGLFTYTPTGRTTPVTVNVLTLAGIAGIDPIIASRILANLPATGNRTDIGDQRNTTGLSFNRTQNQDREAFTMRLDFDPNSKHSFNFVHEYRSETNQRPDLDSTSFTVTPFGFQGTKAPTRLFLLAHAWTPSASFANDFRVARHYSSAVFDLNNAPTDYIITTPAFISNPEPSFRPQGREQKNLTFADNATYTRGNHTFRFGGIAQMYRFVDFNFAPAIIPTFTLSSSGTVFNLSNTNFVGLGGCTTGTCISAADLATANSLVALLGGVVNAGSLTYNATSPTSGYVQGAGSIRNEAYDNFALYVADQWRVTPRLTLSLGLRYELYTPISERDRLFIQPVVAGGQTGQQAVLNPNGSFNFIGVNAGGNKGFNSDKNNFGPNISFAWSPQFKSSFLNRLFPGEGRTVVRGGLRVGFVNDEYIKSSLNTFAFGQGLQQSVNIAPSAPTRLSTGLPGFTQPAFPTFPRSYAADNALLAFQGTVFLVDPNIEIQRTLEYNFGIERELDKNTALEIRYVGSMSNSMLRTIDYNQLEIRENGFLADYQRARQNLSLARARNAAETTAGVPAASRTVISGAFNSAVPGSQPLTVFPNIGAALVGAAIAAGGGLNNSSVIAQLDAGTPGDLAQFYVIRGMGSSIFLPNPNTFVGNLLTNGGRYRYNGLQVELRRRFSQGLYFQANYTFQKTLGDTNVEGSGAAGQNRVDPFLDNRNQQLEYSRVEFDQTHTFNFNGIYELPFGRGKRWLDHSGLVDRLAGGWQITSIISLGSGLPVSIVDPRGTLNRAGRSGRQTANTSLSKDELRDLTGFFDTPCGLFFINPAVININTTTCAGTGRAAEGFGQAPFSGQVFFPVDPGQFGNMERYVLDGPGYFTWDASIIKNIKLTENSRFQIRAEAFGVLNRPYWFTGIGSQSQNITSTTFGRITSSSGTRVIQFVGRLEF
jgi:carboxypeptidase family protein/TonB-dependent receptor-like protein